MDFTKEQLDEIEKLKHAAKEEAVKEFKSKLDIDVDKLPEYIDGIKKLNAEKQALETDNVFLKHGVNEADRVMISKLAAAEEGASHTEKLENAIKGWNTHLEARGLNQVDPRGKVDTGKGASPQEINDALLKQFFGK